MGTALSTPPALVLVATTGLAGFALQNATPNILTWNVPNDGQQHRFALYGERNITVNETGGQMTVTCTVPGGTSFPNVVAAGGSTVSVGQLFATSTVAPGTTVTFAQTSALTAGACQVNAEIWGL